MVLFGHTVENLICPKEELLRQIPPRKNKEKKKLVRLVCKSFIIYSIKRLYYKFTPKLKGMRFDKNKPLLKNF